MRAISFASIRARLTILVLVVVLFALGQSLYAVWQERQAAIDQAKARTLLLVRRLSLIQETLIDGSHQLLTLVAQHLKAHGAESRACSGELAHIHKQFPKYANIGVFKPNGDMFCSAIALTRPINNADRVWFQRVMRTRAFTVGEYVVGRATGKPQLPTAFPILDQAGEVQAVVVAAIDASWLQRFGSESGLSPKSNFIVFDKTGLVLGYYPKPENSIIAQTILATPLYNAALSNKDTQITEVAGPDGVSRVYAFAPLNGGETVAESYVAVGIPKDEIFAEADAVFAKTVELLLILALGIFSLLWYGSEVFINRPVRVLSDAATRFGSGELSARVNLPDNRGELAQLGHAFNQMAASLQAAEAERMRAEDKLLLQAAALESAANGIMITDRQGIIQWVNPAFSDLTGYTANEVIGKRSSLLKSGQHDQPFYQNLWETILAGKVWHSETVNRRKDGRFYTEEQTITPVRNLQGAMSHFIAIKQDVTVRKQAEEKIRKVLNRIRALHDVDSAITSTLELKTVLDLLLQSIFAVLPYDAAATVRLCDKKTGVLEPVACRNVDQEEWERVARRSGRGLAQQVHNNGASLIVRNIQTDPRVTEPEFFRKQGLISYLGVPLIVKGEALGVISFYTKEEHEFGDEEQDFFTALAGRAAIAIHNSQLYERTKMQATELQKANKIKDEFLSVMSHELRTPLHVIMGYTGMLHDRFFGEIKPEQEEVLNKVMEQSKDLLSMITSILQATMIEAEVYSSEVKLSHFLDEFATACETPMCKAPTINWDYPSALPVVKTDREKLKHILWNLVNNATKFTLEGHVTVSARHLLETNSVEFKVADTGIGIAEENLPYIFEMFHQLDGSETRPYGGVGLGLYIVEKYTELLGGTIEVKSELGKGSTFSVTIPCRT